MKRRSDQMASWWLTDACLLLVFAALWQPLYGSSAMVWLSLLTGICTVIFFVTGCLAVVLWLVGA